MIIKCELELNQQKEIFEFNKIAKQANGAVLAQMGNAVVIAAVASEFDNPVSEDFTPLTVEQIEKTYAYAKLRGGFIKRRRKTSDCETQNAKGIDRRRRKLFQKGLENPTTNKGREGRDDKNVDEKT